MTSTVKAVIYDNGYEDFGARKPDPSIFHHITRCLRVNPGEAAYVGDNPEADVAGADRAGLVSVWVENALFEAPKDADHWIRKLGDMLEIARMSSTASPDPPSPW